MDTPAFQHRLSLFPQLTLRQRRVAQQELTAPHAITSLNAQLPACRGCPHCHADAAQLAPWGWSRGLRRYRCKLCLRTSSVLTKTPLARLRKAQCWEDYAQALIEGLTVRQAERCVAGSAKTPLSSGGTVSCARWPLIKPRVKKASLRWMRPSSSSHSRGSGGYRVRPDIVVVKGEPGEPDGIIFR